MLVFFSFLSVFSANKICLDRSQTIFKKTFPSLKRKNTAIFRGSCICFFQWKDGEEVGLTRSKNKVRGNVKNNNIKLKKFHTDRNAGQKEKQEQQNMLWID